jgi:arylsulfatase A-like enzyme
MLLGYASTCVGKWHLAGALGNRHLPGGVGPLHPNASGFDHFAGSMGGALESYFGWAKVTDGVCTTSTTYATTDTADDAIDALDAMPEPWVLYASFNAPHDPFIAPPGALCPLTACAASWCGTLSADPTPKELGKSMVEAFDTELGRLLAHLDTIDPDAYVFFVGDNGTAQQLCDPPFLPAHAKGTLYEGGINVPLIVRGPGVVHGECAALVSVVDFYATCAELAGIPAATEDSVSFAPCLANPSLAPRTSVYSERFGPNGACSAADEHARAVRNERYKLIRTTGEPDELYDLAQDPFETTNLLPCAGGPTQAAYDALVAELVALGVD